MAWRGEKTELTANGAPVLPPLVLTRQRAQEADRGGVAALGFPALVTPAGSRNGQHLAGQVNRLPGAPGLSALLDRARRGDAAGARDQLTTLLPIRERVLGAEHSDTLSTRDSFAYWTKKARSWRWRG